MSKGFADVSIGRSTWKTRSVTVNRLYIVREEGGLHGVVQVGHGEDHPRRGVQAPVGPNVVDER